MSATQAKAGLVSRSVASCFLFKFPPSAKPQVALFRRSGKVSTYQHHLAPIAGSIEETDKSPLAAVWREINEETTLTPAHLKLFRQGKPYSFTDEGVGRIWTVHPFAFSLKSEQDEAKIQIDWEHDGYEWRDPLEVTDDEGFGGVPYLAKSLRRVWFEMDLGERRARILEDGLSMLQNDHESGARQLAGKALDVFRQLVALGEGEDTELWWRNARFSAWHLWKNGRESMGAAVLNVLVRSLGLIEEEIRRGNQAGSVSKENLERVSRRLEEYATERTKTIDGVWQSFLSVLQRVRKSDDTNNPVRILTLSSSSTITESLRRAAITIDSGLDIRVLESRPLFEGVSMASKLADDLRKSVSFERMGGDVNFTLYSDAAAAVASKDVDIVLLGADLIDARGAVSNKTGSLPAVLSAKHVAPDAEIVVLAENEKILPFPSPEHNEENDPAELTAAWARDEKTRTATATLKGESTETDQAATAQRFSENQKSAAIEIKNVYFEWVPPELIHTYVSEDGESSPADVAARAEKFKQEADRFFAEE